MNQIELILAHYEAHKAQSKINNKLNEFLNLLSAGNFVVTDCPFQAALEQLIEEPLKDWYFWWLYENCTQFWIEKDEYDKTTMSLKEFLELVK